MKVQRFCDKTTLHRLANATNVLQFVRKNFSIRSIIKRKKAVACCKELEPSPKIIVPENCRKIKSPISTPHCKVAVVIGGSKNGYGFSAAEQLLSLGAKRVILADNDMKAGWFAAEKLCKLFGMDRARFYPCDITSSCQIQGIFKSPHCKDDPVSILFNDIDAIQSLPESRTHYCDQQPVVSNSRRISQLGMEFMSNETHDSNAIVVNCASVLGFMGWPAEPVPVYCHGGEPVVETTIHMAKSFPMEKTGVRFVALCPANRDFDSIGLPDLPGESLIQNYVSRDASTCGLVPCSPDPSKDRVRLGRALAHVMARAETGSAWILEPPYSLRETPRLVPLVSQDIEQNDPDDCTEKECPVSFDTKKINVPRRCKSKPTPIQQCCKG